MITLRALGAQFLDLEWSDRIAVAVCGVLALAALVAVAVAPAPGHSTASDADTPAATVAVPMTGLVLSRELAADYVSLDMPIRPADMVAEAPQTGSAGASGATLLVAIPLGMWLGFFLAQHRRTGPSTQVSAIDQPRGEPPVTAHQTERFKRSLSRRDRRIARLKKRLNAAQGPATNTGDASPPAVERLEHELEDARVAIQRLEELLQDKQDEWARSEMITARSDSRITALEADLKAAGDIIESLHEDIGYWKRRAVQSPTNTELIDRLTG